MNSYKDVYVYDEQGKQLYVERQVWSDGILNKELLLRGLLTLTATINTNIHEWEYFVRDAFVYDENNNITGGIVQTWDASTSTWKNIFRYMYTKDKKEIFFMSQKKHGKMKPLLGKLLGNISTPIIHTTIV